MSIVYQCVSEKVAVSLALEHRGGEDELMKEAMRRYVLLWAPGEGLTAPWSLAELLIAAVSFG